MTMIKAFEDQARFCEGQMERHYRDKGMYSLWAKRRQEAATCLERMEDLAALDIDRDTRALAAQPA
jgi:hypothetical protein